MTHAAPHTIRPGTSLKFLLSCFATILAMSLSTAAARGAGIPSLTGTWSGASEAAYLDAFVEMSIKLVITRQSGPNFRGYFIWRTPHGTNTQGRSKGREKIAGVVGFDGKSVVIAEELGGGVMQGRLVGSKRIQLIKWQASPVPERVTMAQRMILTRK